MPRGLKTVRRVDQIVSVPLLLFLRHLRCDALLSFRERQLVAQHQPFELDLGPAMDHDQFVETLVTT